MARSNLIALIGVLLVSSSMALKAEKAIKAAKATKAAKAAELADKWRAQVDSLCEAASADFNGCATCIRNNKDELMTNCNVGGYTLVQVSVPTMVMGEEVDLRAAATSASCCSKPHESCPN